MHYKFNVKGFVIDYTSGVTKGFDPTQYVNIGMVNPFTGVSLFLFEFWGTWRLTLPDGRDKIFSPLFHGDRPERRVNVFLRSFEAPTVDEVDELMETQERAWSKDPMGAPSQYE